jgi:hypothetical protein
VRKTLPSYETIITPDIEKGAGNCADDMLARAIRESISFVKNERGEVAHSVFNIDDLARRITRSPGTLSGVV